MNTQEISLNKMAANRGYRLYQWPSGSFCLISHKTGEFCGSGVNMTLDEVSAFLLCFPENEWFRFGEFAGWLIPGPSEGSSQ